ncbi:hypothetical protein HK405_013979, partial [Cladochytrium tenue]
GVFLSRAMTQNRQINNTVGCYKAAIKHVIGLGNRMWRVADPQGFGQAVDLVDKLFGDNDQHAEFGAHTGHAVNVCTEVGCHVDHDLGMCIDFINGDFTGGDFCLMDYGLRMAAPSGALLCFESSLLWHHVSPSLGGFRHSHVSFTNKATGTEGFLAWPQDPVLHTAQPGNRAKLK